MPPDAPLPTVNNSPSATIRCPCLCSNSTFRRTPSPERSLARPDERRRSDALGEGGLGDFPTDHLVAPPPEHLLGTRVPLGDHAGTVHLEVGVAAEGDQLGKAIGSGRQPGRWPSFRLAHSCPRWVTADRHHPR